MDSEERTKRYLESLLIHFARQHPAIRGISRGNCPEGGHEVYYFCIPNGKASDDGLVDAISELDLTLNFQAFKCDLAESPVGLDRIDSYAHLGEVIWRR